MDVLVGYASAHGSTRSIAERIAAVLGDHGLASRAVPLDSAVDAAGYGAFVLGSAVHNRTWLVEAKDFVAANRAVLRTRPVWLFSVGMPAALRGPWRRFGPLEERTISAELRKTVTPRDHVLFSGVFRPEHTSAFGRLLFRAMGSRYGDYRDWARVTAWAEEIARHLTKEPDTD
ncbi:flavodoxin domain-containing protein [Actinomadura gamaensis]|uniref:Flavodoxin domain-containing protein n=1 Tax=Actinomadura gamaensis TaxID=1763541 RepID=A0ABV9TSR0_9ACTN